MVICGRNQQRLAAAAAALRQHARGTAAVHALRCDVSNGHGARTIPPASAAVCGSHTLSIRPS